MCLGELVQVREVRPDGRALADRAPGGRVLVDRRRQVEISLLLLEDPVVAGDWLLVHSGIALSRLDGQDVEVALALRSEVTTGSPTMLPTPLTGGPT